MIHIKHINTLCGQKVEVFNVKPDCIDSNHWASKGKWKPICYLSADTKTKCDICPHNYIHHRKQNINRIGTSKVLKRRHNFFRRKGFSDNKGNKYYHQITLDIGNIFFFFFAVALWPNAGHGLLVLEVFLDHAQQCATVGRNPLDEWSARRRDLYLTTHNTHNRQICMPPVGSEPTISAGERSQTYALDRAATGTGNGNINKINY